MNFRFAPFHLVVLFLCSSSFLSACHWNLKSGHFEGIFLKRSGSQIDQEPIKIEISSVEDGVLAIDIRTLDGRHFLPIWVHPMGHHQLEINARFISSEPIYADRVEAKDGHKETRCYASYKSIAVEFCFKKDQFLLQILDSNHNPYVQLSANLLQEEIPLPIEKPVSLNLTHAIDLAFDKNFDSKIAFEHIMQARFAATAAYLNLVPHLTSNLIWNAAPNYITYVATIQALVPFLLPSYWLQAKEVSLDRNTKDLALTITRANLVTTVEELAYSLHRDSMISFELLNFLAAVNEFDSKLQTSPLDSSLKMKLNEFSRFLLNALNSDLGDIRKLIQQDQFSLAQALGFHNIEAIKEITIDQEILPVERAQVVNPKEIAQLASERSFELRQIDNLKQIAKKKKLENLFIWIDPTGDPKQNLGLNTIPQQKEAKAQIRELEIHRDQTRTNIYQSAYKLALNYNEAIQTFHHLRQDLEVIHPNLNQVLIDALHGYSIDIDALERQSKAYMASITARHTTRANFRIVRAKMDRYLLRGYFLQLLPQVRGH